MRELFFLARIKKTAGRPAERFQTGETVMPTTSQPFDSSHDSVRGATAVEECATVPATVIVDLAHTVVGNLQAENARLVEENDLLRRRLALAGAMLRPSGSVLQ